MKHIATLLLTVAAVAAAVATSGTALAAPGAVKNIVLVHGSFADGSGWRPLAEILEKDGYHVAVVQHPETSLNDDVTAVKRVLAQQDGPVLLVGHSYGGVVVTQAGTDPKVVGLVYVAAMLPDEGEAAGELLQKIPAASKAVTPTADGYLYLDPAQFHADFAADLPKAETHFMALSQVLTNSSAFGQKIVNPAWKTKPSWGIVATEDRAINPELERFMYKRAGSQVSEIKASHAVYISRPKEVAAVIEKAAASIK
ncbi:alpha/beta hydrolase [Undibacterium terreum]|uniref:Alpha/beta hydrolase n=1 Tax=Undibacterium terreum TaxID=1224302 RepID=A0A916XE18_9BURK|nr:alpha/beta hydrolase [Undibacterium terreum]GGC66708.1 alpha/beta hydrolase [Undibacterium terreum]